MELDEIHTPGCKFPRIGNGRSDAKKIGQNGDEQYPDDDDEGVVKRSRGGGGGGDGGGAVGQLSGWPPSMSRIVRVSRASGGKDRHSKVLTSKGLRDRRVRLSVSTAIQFYDLQDRLGYDQPSKAVEWLLMAAASSISELPSLNTSFPETPKQLSDEKRRSSGRGGTEHGFDSAEMELDPDGDPNYHHQQQNVSVSRSTCSSTSETSKGSGLSLARSENRIKARERARERAAEKEKENESQFANHMSRNSSFTELLTGGISSVGNNTTPPSNETAHPNHGGVGGECNLFHKSARLWSSPPMDYFATRFLESSSRTHHSSSGFSGQIHLGNSHPQFTVTAGDHHHQELQQFSFVPDHLMPVASAGGGSSDYNLNFSISPGLAGYNRGTLQSNSSPSFLPHMHRFSPVDGSSLPFFIGSTAAPNAAPVDNHHQFQPGFDGRVQLFYGDGGRHSDHKGKCKN